MTTSPKADNPPGAVQRYLISQFQRPRGLLGGLAGLIMQKRASNQLRNAWTIDLLALRPTDVALEIGFGPGLAIESMAERVGAGRVVGIDHSPAMLRQAERRNRLAITAGRVRLLTGSVDDLDRWPELAGPFDKVLLVNVAQFFTEPVAIFGNLRCRMRTGGLIAVTFQPRQANATDADARAGAQRLARELAAAGFSQVRAEYKQMEPVAAVCVVGVA